MTISAKDQFELWCQIANRLNEIKINILQKEDQIPSFNQVQAKQFEEYTNEMRHALPLAGMDAIPDIQRYTLTQEQYEKTIKEFFPYYDQLQSFLHSKDFQGIFDHIKHINVSLKDHLPDLYLELQLHNHLNDKKLDRKIAEATLRKSISSILNGDHSPEICVVQIKQVIINTYYDIRKTSAGFLGFNKGSSLGDALESFINQNILGNNNKIPHHVKPGDEPPSIQKLESESTGLKRYFP